MNSRFKAIIVAFAAVIFFSAAACTATAQTLNSAEALKEYLDKQPANTPDKPIKVTMNANAPMLGKIADTIYSAGKYVSLNLSGNALTTIPNKAFSGCITLAAITIPNSVASIESNAFASCTGLTSITIPDSVTSIGTEVFSGCTSLASVKIEGNITSSIIGDYRAFPGDLCAKYLVGGIGTYTTKNPGYNAVWTKQ